MSLLTAVADNGDREEISQGDQSLPRLETAYEAIRPIRFTGDPYSLLFDLFQKETNVYKKYELKIQ
jgi:hypothetical protein